MEPFEFSQKFQKLYFVLPTNFNFITETYATPSYLHEDSAKLEVLANLLTISKLQNLVVKANRAKNSFVNFNAQSGFLSVVSEEDPKIMETFLKFEKAILDIAEDQFL